MKTELLYININYTTFSGKTTEIPLSYELFGRPLFSAPIVLVNHALTGNSTVAGKNGWWKSIIGDNSVIDLNRFTVLCFNIPGNGYDQFFIDEYTNFTTKDIAKLYILGLEQLNIKKVDYLIGGSIGGSIGWEMLAIDKDLAQTFIPIATDYKTHDWLHAQCLVQKFLLESEVQPLEKARIHAMLCYRTPESINKRFQNQYNTTKQRLESEDWLLHHGNSLNERFSLKSYLLVNHLLTTIKVDQNILPHILANIHMIGVDTDLFFPCFEITKTFENLKPNKDNIYYHEIKSIHGHDAFLMEYEQLNTILKKIIE